MARSLESQAPGTPAPPAAMVYGQQVPSISFTPQMPGAYPSTPQLAPNPGYQTQQYNQGMSTLWP